MTRRVLAAAGLASLTILASGCSNRPPDDASYVREIAADRAAKDASFKAGTDPVPANRRAELLPLAYFPIDPAYKVPAALRPATSGSSVGATDVQPGSSGGEADNVIEMPTSTGGIRKMRRVGTLEFVLKGRPLKLTAFVEVGAKDVDRLFVPFSDLTTGTETYAGGRYIDLDRSPTGIYEMDFNHAYHPYCYYNPTYECPYPPAENRLPIPVRAGEKLKPTEGGTPS